MNDGNFTRFPNYLLESLYQADFSNSEFRVFLFIVRQLSGYHRPSCVMSGNFIPTGTMLSERSVWKALAALRERGVIKTEFSPCGNVISINEFFTSEQNDTANSFTSEQSCTAPLNNHSVQPLNGCSDKKINTSKKLLKKNDSENFQKIADLFNEICVDLPKVTKLTEPRKKAIQRGDRDLKGDWRSFFETIHKSDFLCGRTGSSNFQASFDWCLLPRNMTKILEGNYNNRPNKRQSNIPTNADYNACF